MNKKELKDVKTFFEKLQESKLIDELNNNQLLRIGEKFIYGAIKSMLLQKEINRANALMTLQDTAEILRAELELGDKWLGDIPGRAPLLNRAVEGLLNDLDE